MEVDILEAYFHKDPRIAVWIDQITETVFTVCLLTGKDSEKEFQKGSQIVSQLTSLLQGISTFPTEYLEDGLKQLLEQQIPDARVIYNYPAFQDTMDRMLREGMSNVINSQNEEVPNTSISILEKTREDHIGEQNGNLGSPEQVSVEELLIELAIPALASFDITCPEFKEIEVDDKTINIKAYGMLRTSQVPEQANPLRRILNKILPNSTVYWNINLMGQTFLAQVENILICLLDSEHPIIIEDFTKEGWKVFMCSSEDLTFPRRLERGIRQIQRLGKKSQIV
ncbi:MAG: hypothetical protein P4L59_17035 [Desulfosporosinus sp.]|nr:hypothetical protein [Desulfosporosinus sp.]